MTNPFLLAKRQHNPILQATRCVDDAGLPRLVFRGEHGEIRGPGFHTRLPSLSFGSAEAASLYAQSPNNLSDEVHSPRIYPVYLKIENPIFEDIDDPFIDLALIEDKLGRSEAVRVALEHEGHIQNTDNWYQIEEDHGVSSINELLASCPEALRDVYLSIYPVLDDPEFIRQARAAGFDGAVHGGSGETSLEPEYRVFSAEQVVSAITGGLSFSDKVEVEMPALAV